ncbi:MAG: YIP1 family protein [Candidatus Sumerlaeia bacterium]|nr:YIP1 family protein [Candidatus Sumerlaeia bacterium]
MTDPQPPQYQVPSGFDPGIAPYVVANETRPGPAWEDSTLPFWNRLIDTFKGVLFDPVRFYATMRTDGDYMKPLWFALIPGIIGMMAAMLFNFAFQGLGMMSAMGNRAGGPSGVEIGVLIGIMLASIILSPVFVVIGILFQAGILHICLMVFGAANRSFETTYRVVCYAQAVQLAAVVPFVGGIAVGLWQVVLHIIGATKAHETDAWRSIMAVFLPMIVCCTLFICVGGLIGVFIAAAAMQ